MGLIRKVYYILLVQIAITLLVTLLTISIDEMRITIASTPGIVIIAAIILSFILLSGLGCAKSLARTVPINYVLLFAFTLCITYVVAYLCAVVNDSFLVVKAVFITASLVASLTLYACMTKTDFTKKG